MEMNLTEVMAWLHTPEEVENTEETTAPKTVYRADNVISIALQS